MKSGISSSLKALAFAGSMALVVGCAQAKPAKTLEGGTAPSGNPVVLVKTTKGDLKIKVYKGEAPITAGNFLDLVGRGFYNGLTFHRYEPGFVIQGGDPQGNGSGNFTDPKTGRYRFIQLEKNPNLNHDAPGTVAMARTNDPNSASCQFYITLAATPFLDNPPGYAVFGKVISGMDTVKKLRAGDRMIKLSVEE